MSNYIGNKSIAKHLKKSINKKNKAKVEKLKKMMKPRRGCKDCGGYPVGNAVGEFLGKTCYCDEDFTGWFDRWNED